MKNTLSLLIRFYQFSFSGLLVVLFGPGCRFTPTCSTFAHQAIHRHGVITGSLLALKRLSHCHPFSQFGPDPVPETL